MRRSPKGPKPRRAAAPRSPPSRRSHRRRRRCDPHRRSCVGEGRRSLGSTSLGKRHEEGGSEHVPGSDVIPGVFDRGNEHVEQLAAGKEQFGCGRPRGYRDDRAAFAGLTNQPGSGRPLGLAHHDRAAAPGRVFNLRLGRREDDLLGVLSPIPHQPLWGEPDEPRVPPPAPRCLARHRRKVKDRGLNRHVLADRPGPGEHPLSASGIGTVRFQRRRPRRRSDLELELRAEGLEQLLDFVLLTPGDDQRPQAESRGLERAVEGASARAAGSVGRHVCRHVSDRRVVEPPGGDRPHLDIDTPTPNRMARPAVWPRTLG
jgi:hypothetical protein